MNRIDSPTFRPATQSFSDAFFDRCRQSAANAMKRLIPPGQTASFPTGPACRPSFDALEDRVVPSTTYQFPTSAYTVSEGDGVAEIAITRTGDIAQSGTVNWTTSDGTATAPDDYTSSSGTAFFTAGTSATVITVPIVDDTIPDWGEYLHLALSSPTYSGGTGTLGSFPCATLTIYDDDPSLFLDYDVAENETLNAESGVGVQNHLAGDGNDEFTVAGVIVDGTAYITGAAISTHHGTVAVSTDGSFNYTPSSNYTGPDEFRIIAYRDSEPRWEDVTMNVADDAYESEDTFYTTDSGTLEYVSSAFGEEQSARLAFVPYSLTSPVLAGGAPTINFGVFANTVRLYRINVVRNVLLPDDGTATLHLRLSNFFFWDGMDVVEQNANVRRDLTSVMAHFAAVGDDLPSEAGFRRWFTDGYDTTDWGWVVTVYQDIVDDLDSATDEAPIKYTDDPTDNEWGYAVFGANDISIGNWYWNGSGENPATDRDRFGTVIHELSHSFPDDYTVDYGYFNNPGALDGDDIVWNDDPLLTLDTSQLITNADSYAGYLTQYYY